MESTEIAEAPKEFQQVIEAAPPPPPAPPPPVNVLPVGKKPVPIASAPATQIPTPAASVTAKAAPTTARAAPVAKAALKGPTKKGDPFATKPIWKPKGWPYGVGEKIVWNFRWGLIEAGQAKLETLPTQMIDGKQALHFKGSIKSTKMLELFYKVDNRIDTWISLDRHLPLRQEIEQLESKRWGRRVIVFNQDNLKARFFQDMTKAGGKREITKKVTKMTPAAQDIFGALYFYRFVDPGKNYLFPIHDRYKNWTAALTYLGEETLRVPAGKFETYHYHVLPKLAGGLEPKGEVDVWLSKDDARVIVQFKAKIKLGSVTGELVEYQRGRPSGLKLPDFVTPLSPVKAR